MFKKMEDDWNRKEYFTHYMNVLPTTFSTTVHLDITELYYEIKKLELKLYPVQIYLLARTVQTMKEFRTDEIDGTIGYWEILHPSYTILNEKTKTFSSIWTPYQRDFSAFYSQCVSEIEIYKDSQKLFPQKNMPENVFNISSLPWLEFTSFNLNVFTEGTYLKPIFTMGRLMKKNGKITIPLAIQVHHAACDGYHVGKFVEEIKELIATWALWLD
ncbi:type A chloramphenicol O-acetyltransferase [Enterococcus sp. BWR-S5]|uniref:type A chloramphenicol O-acetyltransferase n=1 Tax=Enterococcus sp. BWR-S5 TaxID=2787714 RepID=UPI001924121D|nr:type A chloramphenicol O-acetyltransferase [Enterococcus sp. BWR-S5]MBL1224181.1 type A chloramphenicol O-acetyltransferase [Enterococcus sp. BWR-S5]